MSESGEPSEEIIQADAEPTGVKEAEAFAGRRLEAQTAQLEQNVRERRRFAMRAYRMAQLWICFLIIVVILQIFLRIFGSGLHDKEFITVVTTTTGTVFGFWWLVGRYLFPPGK
jgi:hypothetical protein